MMKNWHCVKFDSVAFCEARWVVVGLAFELEKLVLDFDSIYLRVRFTVG